MIEYHAWASVEFPERESGGDSPTPSELAGVVAAIDALTKVVPIVGYQHSNGKLHFWAAGSANHRCAEVERLWDFYKNLPALAPESYGLVYVRDDEDSRGFNDSFAVWKLALGRLEEVKDTLLSPCIPIIEFPID